MSRAKVWPLIYLLVFIGTLVMNYLTSMNVGRVANQDRSTDSACGLCFFYLESHLSVHYHLDNSSVVR